MGVELRLALKDAEYDLIDLCACRRANGDLGIFKHRIFVTAEMEFRGASHRIIAFLQGFHQVKDVVLPAEDRIEIFCGEGAILADIDNDPSIAVRLPF